MEFYCVLSSHSFKIKASRLLISVSLSLSLSFFFFPFKNTDNYLTKTARQVAGRKDILYGSLRSRRPNLDFSKILYSTGSDRRLSSNNPVLLPPSYRIRRLKDNTICAIVCIYFNK